MRMNRNDTNQYEQSDFVPDDAYVGMAKAVDDGFKKFLKKRGLDAAPKGFNYSKTKEKDK
jgi:hypothetical protein